MGDRERDDPKRDDFKVFVGGLSWQMKEGDLKEAFAKYDPVDATIILDRHTNRPRGFGFVWFKDKLGMEDAIRDMHEKELEGRKISVVGAVPMDQTKPGTPAHVLGGGGGGGGRGGGYDRYPPRDPYRDYGRGYDRGYDRGGAAYGGYERPAYGAYDRGAYERGYDSRGYAGYDPRSYAAGYADPYAARSDPYAARDPYAGYGGYDRGYDAYDSSRGASGPDRRGYASAPRSGPYDRPAERRSEARR